MKPIHYIFSISIFFIAGVTKSQMKDVVPTHDEFKIDSKLVGETRTINVWVPPGYKTSVDSLPVMYMADGGMLKKIFHILQIRLQYLLKIKRFRQQF